MSQLRGVGTQGSHLKSKCLVAMSSKARSKAGGVRARPMASSESFESFASCTNENILRRVRDVRSELEVNEGYASNDYRGDRLSPMTRASSFRRTQEGSQRYGQDPTECAPNELGP